MQAKKLRELLNDKNIICAPGAYDAWSAKLIADAGFPAVYMTGYGVSASVLGQPDIGLIGMSEMANAAGNIAHAANIPLIADADNGYGNTLNVIRTVQAYERAGVAAIQIEDQVMPKRCGHMEGKELISQDDMVAKIRAAVYAKQCADTLIIARTDARAVNGFGDAIARAQAYVAAGADVIFFEAPDSIEEMREVRRLLPVPLLANMVENGKTPLLSLQELEQLGYNIAIFPASLLYAATKAVSELLGSLKTNGTTKMSLDNMVDFPTFNKMIGVQEYRDLEKSFSK